MFVVAVEVSAIDFACLVLSFSPFSLLTYSRNQRLRERAEPNKLRPQRGQENLERCCPLHERSGSNQRRRLVFVVEGGHGKKEVS